MLPFFVQFGSTGSAAVKHEVQPDKQRTDTGTNVGHQEGIYFVLHTKHNELPVCCFMSPLTTVSFICFCQKLILQCVLVCPVVHKCL